MKELQQSVIKALHVKPEINPKEEIRTRVDFMKEYLQKFSFANGFVLGISGGQDSTLLSKLAQIAIDELNEEEEKDTYQFIGVKLPYGKQGDATDVEDAIAFIQPSQVKTINIKAAVDASEKALHDAGVEISDFLKGNEKARERMKAQYSIAGVYNCFVLGTDHAAEAVTGFFTKHGDGGCDLVPLDGLSKRQGKQMLEALGCPKHLYLKKPTADLEDDRPALADEDALGVTYDEVDDYLEGKEVPQQVREVIESHYIKTMHKREPLASVHNDWWK